MATDRKTGWQTPAALVVLLAAIAIPVLVAYGRAIDRDYDSPPHFIAILHLIFLAVLLAIFAPAVILAVSHSPDVPSLAVATAVIVFSLASAYTCLALFNDSVVGLLGFPLAGFVAAVGTWAAQIYVPPWTDRRRHM